MVDFALTVIITALWIIVFMSNIFRKSDEAYKRLQAEG
jgi:hypothetical protein